QVQQLAHELGRARVLRVPVLREDKEVRADEALLAVRQRLVDDDLRRSRIQNAIADQVHLYVMKPHGAVVGAADAAEMKLIALGNRNVDVAEPSRGLTNRPHELACMLFRRVSSFVIVRAALRAGWVIADRLQREGSGSRERQKA